MSEFQPYTGPVASPGMTPSMKPGQVTTIGVLAMISGITNIMAGIGWSIGMIASLVGIICVPIALLPIALGIFEIIYAAKLLNDPPRTNINQTIHILEIVGVLSGNIISLVAGILGLVFGNDTVVKAYFAGQPVPAHQTTPSYQTPPATNPAGAPYHSVDIPPAYVPPADVPPVDEPPVDIPPVDEEPPSPAG